MLNWLLGKPKFVLHEDSFARTRETMLEGLRSACQQRLDSGDSVVLISHFAETFECLQQKLSQWEMDYEIFANDTRPNDILRWIADPYNNVFLCLASMLRTDEAILEKTISAKKVCAVVAERHPLGHHDEQLLSYFQSLPCPVEMGYFLSFEDESVKRLVDGAALRILDMFGMGQNELVASNMVSRRLKSILKRNSTDYKTDIPADSAKQWFELNEPGKQKDI